MKKMILICILVVGVLFGTPALVHAVRGDRIGDHYFTYTTYTNEVYMLYTPRGWEKCLDIYLQDSLDKYQEQGVLGKRIEEIEQ